MKGREFIFKYVHLLHKCHKINSDCGGLCKDSPDLIKAKNINKSY